MNTPTQAGQQRATRSTSHFDGLFLKVNHNRLSRARVRQIRSVVSALLICLAVSTTATSCSRNERSEGEPPNATPSAQPLVKAEFPPIDVPRIRVESTDAVIVYKAWTANGRFTQGEPPDAINWPRVDMSKPFTVVVDSSITPTSVAARYFTTVPSSESPDNASIEFSCEGKRSAARALCTPKPSDSRQEFVIELPQSAKALILNIDWYVPSQLRTSLPEAPSTNSVAAGWASA